MLAASIPSELTKQAAKIRQSDEDKYMDMLLSEEQKRKQPSSLPSSPSPAISSLDYVDFTTDVTKWLEYSVLCTNFPSNFHIW